MKNSAPLGLPPLAHDPLRSPRLSTPAHDPLLSPLKAEGLSAISASHTYHLRGSINSAALREKSDNQRAVFGLNKKVMKSGEEHCLETHKLLQWPPPMAATNLKGNQTTNLTAICLSLRLAVNARDWIETS